MASKSNWFNKKGSKNIMGDIQDGLVTGGGMITGAALINTGGPKVAPKVPRPLVTAICFAVGLGLKAYVPPMSEFGNGMMGMATMDAVGQSLPESMKDNLGLNGLGATSGGTSNGALEIPLEDLVRSMEQDSDRALERLTRQQGIEGFEDDLALQNAGGAGASTNASISANLALSGHMEINQ